MILKVLVAEDDHHLRAYLKKTIEEVPGVSVIEMVNNGKDAVRLVEKHRPHVVFLDIDMPIMSGIEAAIELANSELGLNFVFVTGHADFALEAFGLYSFDYILKPFKDERIKMTVWKLKEKVVRERSNYNSSTLGMFIEIGRRNVFLNFHEIVFMESQRSKVFIKSVSAEYSIIGNLNAMEEKLNPQIFFRSHKGYIVNLMHYTR